MCVCVCVWEREREREVERERAREREIQTPVVLEVRLLREGWKSSGHYFWSAFAPGTPNSFWCKFKFSSVTMIKAEKLVPKFCLHQFHNFCMSLQPRQPVVTEAQFWKPSKLSISCLLPGLHAHNCVSICMQESVGFNVSFQDCSLRHILWQMFKELKQKFGLKNQ